MDEQGYNPMPKVQSYRFDNTLIEADGFKLIDSENGIMRCKVFQWNVEPWPRPSGMLYKITIFVKVRISENALHKQEVGRNLVRAEAWLWMVGAVGYGNTYGTEENPI